MNYSGTPSLSQETKQRILTTFDQTLTLAEQGNRQEAMLGCDFILRMDPQFEPARQLHERLKAATGTVETADLRGGGAAPLYTSEDLFGDLADADLGDLPADLAELEELPAGGMSGIGSPGDAGGVLLDELEQLLTARRHQDLLDRAGREAARVSADPRLAAVVQTAQERLEAEPYVLKFVAKTREAVRTGDTTEAGRLLDKARALDPSHPEIVALARQVQAQAAALTMAVPAPQAPAPSSPAPAPAPAAPTMDLPAALRSTPFDLNPGGSGDAESERRIAQLLTEGQAAFDIGDHQGAIDAWSRIFLIDIDHQEAARRIELARKLKAERERQVEEIFHDGMAQLDAGDLTAAREAFEHVLALQPGYLAAREYLQQIDAGQVPTPSPRPVAPPRETASPVAAGRPAPELTSTPLPAYDDDDGPLKEEILVPPDLGEGEVAVAKPAARRSTAVVRTAKPSRTFLYVGGGVLLLVLAAGAYLFQNKDRFWPNSTTEESLAPVPPGGPGPAEDPIQRATRLQKEGKTPLALRQLQRITEGDPQYEEAQRLIAEWQASPQATPASTEPALDAEVTQRRDVLLAAARQAAGASQPMEAVFRFEQAATLAPLAPDDAAQLAAAKSAIAAYATQVDLFRQHEWELLLPQLWRLLDQDSGNRDVRQMLIDSYYNLAVRDLQRSDPAGAYDKLQEALKLAPDDPALRRHSQFAQTYREQGQDLLYRIYVKYLPVR